MPIRAEWDIAKQLYFADKKDKVSSRPAIKVALAGIIIGMMVMVVTICVVVGFKRTITQKVAGFGAHIQIVNFDNNNTYEMKPIVAPDSLLDNLRAIDNVKQVSTFLTKPGIIKTDDAFQGIVLKGTEYWDYFSSSLLEGSVPQAKNEVLVSRSLAQRLKLELGKKILCYFVGEQVRVRPLVVSGIYETGFGDFDMLFVIGQQDIVRKLNGWKEEQVSGIEILLDKLQDLEETADAVYFQTANRLDADGNGYYTQTIEQLNPQIFAWLDLLDMNVVVIIVLMLCVSGFNIISGLIILIMTGIRFIGTLKALGATNRFVRRIFMLQAAMLIGKGVLIGNVLGLGLVLLQYLTHVLPLDSTTYYVNYVPVAFPWGGWIALNIGTILLSMLILLAPSAIVTKISPAKVMHFE